MFMRINTTKRARKKSEDLGYVGSQEGRKIYRLIRIKKNIFLA